MAESIFMRVRRLISASVEDAVDAMERAGGTSVMREAIREVDRAIDEVRTAQEAATARRLQAMRQQRLFREKLTVLEDKARFALSQNREDLAEAAVSRQLDFEAEARRLDEVQEQASSEAAELETCLVSLTTRRTQMEEALSAFTVARQEAACRSDGSGTPQRRTRTRVERAEQAFDRAMAGAGGVSGLTRADGAAIAKVAEIATLERSATIAQRMAGLRRSGDASRPSETF